MPELPATSLEIELPDRAATQRLAVHLARILRNGDVVALSGVLGAGKTTLVRDIVEALAGGPYEVPSPTFTLMQHYDLGAVTVWHFDLHRIERAEDVLELGFEDALAEGVVLVEWPDRLGPLLPAERLDVTMEQGASRDARRARIVAHGGWAARIGALADA